MNFLLLFFTVAAGARLRRAPTSPLGLGDFVSNNVGRVLESSSRAAPQLNRGNDSAEKALTNAIDPSTKSASEMLTSAETIAEHSVKGIVASAMASAVVPKSKLPKQVQVVFTTYSVIQLSNSAHTFSSCVPNRMWSIPRNRLKISSI